MMHKNYCSYPIEPCCCGIEENPQISKYVSELQTENKRLKEKIDLALLELAKVEDNATPTELRVVKALEGTK